MESGNFIATEPLTERKEHGDLKEVSTNSAIRIRFVNCFRVVYPDVVQNLFKFLNMII